MKCCPQLSRRKNSPRRPVPKTNSARVPLWLLVGLLSVLSLVAVGVLTYFLVYTRTAQAMDAVAVSYRALGFLTVQNQITGTLGNVAAMTKLLGLQAAAAPSGA